MNKVFEVQYHAEVPILAHEYQVMTVPTLMLFKDEKPIESTKGFHP